MDEQIIQLRKAQLMIAQEIKRICEKCNINYFLDAGSMLGAVRHGGFIPWDDDMDIGMLDADYQKFLAVASKELGKKYYLDNYHTNDENGLVFSKVRLLGTLCIENKGNPDALHNEISVDIFPYYYISDNRIVQKVEAAEMSLLTHILLSKSGCKVWKGESRAKRLKFFPIDILTLFISRQRLHTMIERLCHQHDGTKTFCIHDGVCYSSWHIPAEAFHQYIEKSFEGVPFRIPRNYDLFLKAAYGDYMQLPPPEKRLTHQIRKLDFGKYDLN